MVSATSKAFWQKLPLFSGKRWKTFVLICFLVCYLIAGLYAEISFLAYKPLDIWLHEDFGYYRNGLNAALAGGDPYAERTIGPAYLYPPAALLMVEFFDAFEPASLEISVYTVFNILLLVLMIAGVARRCQLPLSAVWWWFPLGLGFAPFIENLHLGQINMLTQFGVFLLFYWQQAHPFLAGAGLTLGVLTKVTPVALVAYIVITRNRRALAGFIVALLILVAAAGLRYGFAHWVTFVDVFQNLLGEFVTAFYSHSTAAVLTRHGIVIDPPLLQRGLMIYTTVLVGSTLLLADRVKVFEPVFIILQIALTLVSNLVWYTHFVFLLLPIFVWMAWARLHPAVVVWCLAWLFMIQFEQLGLTTGLLTHLFGHVSMWALFIWYAMRVVAHFRSGGQTQDPSQPLQPEPTGSKT